MVFIALFCFMEIMLKKGLETHFILLKVCIDEATTKFQVTLQLIELRMS